MNEKVYKFFNLKPNVSKNSYRARKTESTNLIMFEHTYNYTMDEVMINCKGVIAVLFSSHIMARTSYILIK